MRLVGHYREIAQHIGVRPQLQHPQLPLHADFPRHVRCPVPWRWKYDTAGRLTKQTLPTGAYTTYEYDSDTSRLSDLHNYAPDDSLLSSFTDISYDTEGKRTGYTVTIPSENVENATRTFSYDPLRGRLVTETYSALNLDNSYSYDAAGNHTGAFHGRTLADTDYDRSNQLVGEEYAYTAEGDPTTYKGNTLGFDVEHHLTSYNDGQNPSVTAAYGPDGLRAWKQAAGGAVAVFDASVFMLDTKAAVRRAITVISRRSRR